MRNDNQVIRSFNVIKNRLQVMYLCKLYRIPQIEELLPPHPHSPIPTGKVKNTIKQRL